MTRTHPLILLMLLALPALPDTPTAAQLRTLDSRHYRIHTDLSTELAEDLALRLDAVYDEYSRRLVDFGPRGQVQRFEVYLFEKQADYEHLTGGRFPNTGGVFMSSRNILAAFLEQQGRDALRRTLQHEAFHQFAFTNISPRLPIWLNEGLAQVFEEGIYVDRQLMVGAVPPRRLRQLQQLIDEQRLMPFPNVLSMTERDWASRRNDVAQGEAQYAQAWGMVHFLVFAVGDDGQPRYRERFLQMLRSIHGGEDGYVAFTKAFSTNIKGFEQRFREWAASLQPTPLAQYIEHQNVLADMLLALRRQGHSFSTVSDFGAHVLNHLYRLRYAKGSAQWLTDADPKVYFSTLDGRHFERDQLRFELRGQNIPDLVCRPMDNIELRTRFHGIGNTIEHELIVEMIR